MNSFFSLATHCFWHFLGCFLLLYVIVYYSANLVLQIIHKVLRAKTIRLQGYPPAHCDADGDFKSEEQTTTVNK